MPRGTVASPFLDFPKEREEFVTATLGIPESWVNEGKSLVARYHGDKYTEAEQLVYAGRWKSGHDVIMHHIAADALIDDQTGHLRSLLNLISPIERSSLIPNWETAGKVYLDYISISSRIKALQEVDMPQVDEMEELWLDLTSLCQRVSNLETRNARGRLAKAELGKQALNMYQIVHSLQHQDDHMMSPSHPASYSSPFLEKHIEQLRLPEDYAIPELTAMVREQLTSLTSSAKSRPL